MCEITQIRERSTDEHQMWRTWRIGAVVRDGARSHQADCDKINGGTDFNRCTRHPTPSHSFRNTSSIPVLARLMATGTLVTTVK